MMMNKSHSTQYKKKASTKFEGGPNKNTGKAEDNLQMNTRTRSEPKRSVVPNTNRGQYQIIDRRMKQHHEYNQKDEKKNIFPFSHQRNLM